MTPDTWHMTCDTQHRTCDTRNMVRAVEHSLKISAPQLLRFGIECLQDSKRKDHMARPSENSVSLITNPLTTCSTNFKEEKIWHLPRDTWHVTYWGGWTFSKNISFLALKLLSNSTTELIHTSLGTLFLSYCSNLGKGGRSSLPNLFTNQ